MLDENEPPDKICNIAMIPQSEKYIVLGDCDSDGSDMDYEGQTGHLSARMLNAHAEVMQVDEWNTPHRTLSPIHHSQWGMHYGRT